MADRRSYQFGRFRLDASGRVLYYGGQAVALPPKAADTLLLLLQRAGEVVEKEDLLKQVWRDSFVEEGSLTLPFPSFAKRCKTNVADSSVSPPCRSGATVLCWQ